MADAHSHAHDHAHAGHDHGHGHGHAHSRLRDERRLFATLILGVLYMGVEAFGGWYYGSLALLADAGHMLSDAAALGVTTPEKNPPSPVRKKRCSGRGVFSSHPPACASLDGPTLHSFTEVAGSTDTYCQCRSPVTIVK